MAGREGFKATEYTSEVLDSLDGFGETAINTWNNLEYSTDDPDYEQSRYDFNSRVFPLDIGQPGYNGHYMVININVLNNSRFNGQVTSPTGVIKTYDKLQDTSKTDVLRFVIDDKWKDSNGDTFKVKAVLPRQTRRIAESIAIYMPNTVVYDTVNDYDQTSLSSIAPAFHGLVQWVNLAVRLVLSLLRPHLAPVLYSRLHRCLSIQELKSCSEIQHSVSSYLNS